MNLPIALIPPATVVTSIDCMLRENYLWLTSMIEATDGPTTTFHELVNKVANAQTGEQHQMALAEVKALLKMHFEAVGEPSWGMVETDQD